MLKVLRILPACQAAPASSFSRFSAFSTATETTSKNDKQNGPSRTCSQLDATLEKDKLYSRLEIELRGIDPAVLKSYSWFATTTASNLGIEVGNCWAPRKAYHDRLTLLKSVHIFKKHRVQYEVRTHFRFLNFYKITSSTLDTFLEYIERNLPEGVALNATRVEIQGLPAHLKEPPVE